jgi:hypothetical protein
MRRLYLKRFSATNDGTWGVFCSDEGKPLFFTAEIPNTFLGPGVYTCKLQTHYQSNGSSYPAYEITGVQGHTDVEIHIGNIPTPYKYDPKNKKLVADSEGCCLVGMEAGESEKYPGFWGVWFSTTAHNKLLKYLDNAPEFYLEITEQL